VDGGNSAAFVGSDDGITYAGDGLVDVGDEDTLADAGGDSSTFEKLLPISPPSAPKPTPSPTSKMRKRNSSRKKGSSRAMDTGRPVSRGSW